MAKRRYWRFGVSGLALAAVIAGGAAMAPGAALAQAAPAAASRVSVDIPAGPLSGALRQLADVSGVQLLYPSALTEGLRTPGLHGSYTVSDAIGRLLAGTGLTYRFTGASTVTLEPPPVAGARTLGAVQVEGVQSEGFASLNGFGAGAGSNGSSDPTATEGTGSFTTNGASIASRGAPTALKDTPQSVSVITQERIQQENLRDLTSAMANTPGITLFDQTEGNVIAESRGFQIHSIQVDGGASTQLNFGGQYISVAGISLAEYDNVQVLRGSDALYAGAGDPGGVISLQRKRPLDHEQFSGGASAGSWSNYDVLADETAPIGFDGHLRARLVAEYNDKDFFYQTAHETRAFVYGVLEGDLDANTIVRAGGSFQNQNDTAPNESGLPRAANGDDLHLPRWTNFEPTWGHMYLRTSEFFVTIEHRFNNDWRVTANATRNWSDTHQVELSATGLVLPGGGGGYPFQVSGINRTIFPATQYSADITLNGKFKMLGMDQLASAGLDYSDSSTNYYAVDISPGTLITDIYHFNPETLGPEPEISGPVTVAQNSLRQWGLFANANLQPFLRLHIVGGFRLSSYSTHNYTALPGYSLPFISDTAYQSTPTPYGSISYGLTSDITVYASYADIFNTNNDDADHNGKLIPPTVGATYQTGIKGAFNDGKLNASLEFYYTNESNVAIYDPSTPYPAPYLNCCYFSSGAYVSHGVDLEVTGEILPGWQAQFGYSYGENYYNSAFDNYDYTRGSFESQEPKHQVKFWTSYTAPSGWLSRWTFAGGIRFESGRYASGYACTGALDANGNCLTNTYAPFQYTQGPYSVVDLSIGYRIDKHWQAQLGATNVGDTRYYATAGSPYYANFYGEPRAFMFTVRAKY